MFLIFHYYGFFSAPAAFLTFFSNTSAGGGWGGGQLINGGEKKKNQSDQSCRVGQCFLGGDGEAAGGDAGSAALCAQSPRRRLREEPEQDPSCSGHSLGEVYPLLLPF